MISRPHLRPFLGMSEKLNKILLALSVAFLITLGFFIYFQKERRNDFEIDFLSVGQGDAELIRTPYGQNILVDGGPDRSVLKRLGENLPFWDRTIDLMVLTHPHDDHVTGLIDVLKKYEVKRILYTGAVHSGPSYLAWLEAVREKKIPVTIIDKKQKITLGADCDMEIAYPEESLLDRAVEDLNDTSIVMKIRYGRTSFLLAGDAGVEVEKKLISENIDLGADVFKASHHGSETANSEAFLGKISPSIVIIEVGKDNRYGHPDGRVIKRFERIGAQVYRTDLDGTIKIVSDGKTAKIRPF